MSGLTGKEIRKGTGDVLRDLEYAQRFVGDQDVAGMLGLQLDFINRALRVAHGEIRTLRTNKKSPAVRERLIAAATRADWDQVRLNGGPPCFHLEADGDLCLRAQRWLGHDDMHRYVPLAELLK